MGIAELLFLAIGLSMDAFAASVCKGIRLKKAGLREGAICGLWFGSFQALMPLLGYLLGSRFEKYITRFAPWVALVLLTLIGINMLREAFSGKEEEVSPGLDARSMFIMAVATSIDALSVGITFACVPITVLNSGETVNTLLGVSLIGVTTFLLSGVGVKIGNLFGLKYKSGAEVAGGVILIIIGLKIILEHFGVL